MITLTTTDNLDRKTESRNFDIYNYGTDNLYPNHNRVLAQNSSALKRCVKTYADFVYGRGMSTVDDFWKKKINARGLRIDQFLRRLVQSEFAIHGGFAFKVGYSGTLDPVSLTPVPFETLRLAKDDDFGIIKKIRYHKDWAAKTIKKADIKTYNVYNPDKTIIARQIEAAGGYEKYLGQIFYYGDNGEIAYPYSKFHASLEDVNTDILLKKGRNSNASTNFSASHFLNMPWDWYELAENYIAANPDQKKSIQQVADDLKDEWVTNLGLFQGIDQAGKIAILTSFKQDNDGKIIFPKLEKIDIQDYDKRYTITADEARNNIRGEYQIPNILLEHVNTGFATTEMQDAYNYYNNITSADRQIFEEVFMEIIPIFDGNFTGKETFEIKKLEYATTELQRI